MLAERTGARAWCVGHQVQSLLPLVSVLLDTVLPV